MKLDDVHIALVRTHDAYSGRRVAAPQTLPQVVSVA